MALPPPSSSSTAVITGSSSGIGAEIAKELARRGHGVTLVARRADRLKQLAEELADTKVRAEVLAADLSDRAERAALLERVAELGLVPEILVNNAGLSTVGPIAKANPQAEVNMIEVDVVAVVDLCTRFLPGMVERRRGAILNLASTAAFQPLPGQAGYGAAKAFVLSYTHSLAGEARSCGVSVTALCPGPVHTEFERTAGFREGEAQALPGFMWVDAAAVARTGVDALERGRTVAIPGVANQVAAALAHLAPRRVLVPLLASQHPGMRRD